MEKIFVSTYGIIENNGKILVLLRKSNDSFSSDKWGLPGGTMNFGEDGIDSLKRNVKSDCGLEIEVLSPIDVCVDVNEDKKEQNVAISYVSELKSGQVKLAKNIKEFKWIDPKKVPDLEELDWVLEKVIYPYIEMISA